MDIERTRKITSDYSGINWNNGDVITRQKIQNIDNKLYEVVSEVLDAQTRNTTTAESNSLGDRLNNMIIASNSLIDTNNETMFWVDTNITNYTLPDWEDFDNLILCQNVEPEKGTNKRNANKILLSTTSNEIEIPTFDEFKNLEKMTNESLRGKGLLKNEDLNTIIEPGSYYYIGVQTAITKCENIPDIVFSSGVPFNLLVFPKSPALGTDRIVGITQIIVTFDNKLFYRYKQLENWTEWETVLTETSGFSKFGILINEDLNNLTNAGSYYCVEFQTINNIPPNMRGTFNLFIIRGSNKVDHGTIQILINFYNEFYYRYKRAAGWTDWVKILSDQQSMTFKKLLSSEDSLDNLLTMGTYYCNGIAKPIESNVPFFNNTYNLIVLPTISNDYGLVQFVITNRNEFYYRYKTLAYGWQNWTQIGRADDDVQVIQDNNNVYVISDQKNNILFSINDSGEVNWEHGVPKPIKQELNNIDDKINNLLEQKENSDYIYAFIDQQENVLGGIEKDGGFNFKKINFSDKNITDLQQALIERGITFGEKSQIDWSNASELHIPEPLCAIINISGIDEWPVTKNQDLHAWMEFWDVQGNYFKKRIIMNAQGAGTMRFIKKSASFDICNDEWIKDDKFYLRIGKWVPQYSFHLKAYYTEAFRGICPVSYKLMDEFCQTLDFPQNRSWKRLLIDNNNLKPWGSSFGGFEDFDMFCDTGARGFPDGFPSIVFLNEQFYGLYGFQLKKDYANAHMEKNNPNHIWLDGWVYIDSIFDGSITWEETPESRIFEIRYPKKLTLKNGKNYDFDDPEGVGELIDENTAGYDVENKTHKITNKVKQNLINFSQVMPEAERLADLYEDNKTTENLNNLKSYFEEHFDIISLIDYLIFSDVVNDTDTYVHNWQWFTLDGIKWAANIYDTDNIMGQREFWPESTRYVPLSPPHHGEARKKYNPMRIIINYYKPELKERYKLLRDKKIIDANHITNMLNDWCSRYGVEAYEKEYTRWPESWSHGNSIVNKNWEKIGYYKDELTDEDRNAGIEYDNEKTYSIGDTCVVTGNSELSLKKMGYYLFKAIAVVKGVHPIVQWKMNLSVYNIYQWLKNNINITDEIYEYNL